MTEYEKTVKKALIDKGMSQKDLIARVEEETGLYVDSSYMSRIYRGVRAAPKVVESINRILEIKQEG